MGGSPTADSGTSPAGESRRGIAAMRLSIGFGPEEEKLVHAIGPRVGPCVDGWVDRFYFRMLTDPIAASVLKDDGMVIRLKRSLAAWFHELFTLPHDEAYERTRAAIGRTHVRIGMPQYLMVTAMGALRRDVLACVRNLVSNDPDQAQETLLAVEMVMDLELALMIEAYRRTARDIARRRDRAVFGERAARRFAELARDRVDAALCYVHLACTAEGTEREDAVARVGDALRTIGTPPRGMIDAESLRSEPARETRMDEILARALDDMSVGDTLVVESSIAPHDLTATVRAEAVKLALEELLQNAATHGGARLVRVMVRRGEGGTGVLLVEVRDDGKGWNGGIGGIEDLPRQSVGLGLAFCDLVAELHDGRVELFNVPGGGAGARLILRVPER